MGSLFRSAEMARLRLYFDRAAAHATVAGLGRLGAVQFRDLNAGQSGWARAFAADVGRCAEMGRLLRYLSATVAATPGLAPVRGSEDAQLATEADEWWDEGVGGEGGSGGVPAGAPDRQLSMDDLNAHLVALERQLLDAAAHEEALATQHQALVEARYVLEMGSAFFRGAPPLGVPDEVGAWPADEEEGVRSRRGGGGGWGGGGGGGDGGDAHSGNCGTVPPPHPLGATPPRRK
eukprot:contig_9931_g2376